MSRLNKRKQGDPEGHERPGQRARSGGSEPPGGGDSGGAEGGRERGSRRFTGGRPAADRGSGARRLGGALRAGGKESGGQLAGFGRAAAGRIEHGLVRLGQLTAALVAAGVALAAALLPYVQIAGRALRRGVEAASRVITPARAIGLAAIGCALLLGAAQFADYRGVGIGTDQYRGLEGVAPAPEVDRRETGSAHSYLLLPAALLAIAALALALRTRRWRACRLAAGVGIAAVVVSIVVDRPAGLDPGEAARDFVGVQASLLGGFWMQLCAGIALTLTSLLLAAELRRGPARHPGRRGAPERKGGARQRPVRVGRPRAEGSGA